MQWFRICAVRTRDMLGYDVYLDVRGIDGQPTLRRLSIGSFRYSDPLTLGMEECVEIANTLKGELRETLRQPRLLELDDSR